MGMKPNTDGSLAPVPVTTEEVKKTPELQPEMPYFDIKEYSPLIDSACMGPQEWCLLQPILRRIT